MNIRMALISLLLCLPIPVSSFADVILNGIKFKDDGKIVFSDNSEQGTATLKGDTGETGPQGPQGPKGDPGTPGSVVTKEAICQVYADEGVSPPPFCGKKVIFVTSQLFTGNLGGLAGADAKCQDAANSAGINGVFKAWLSDSNFPAKNRLSHSPSPYVRTDGAIIANNWIDLTDGWLKDSILCDENKNCLYSTYPETVFTSTDKLGSLYGYQSRNQVIDTVDINNNPVTYTDVQYGYCNDWMSNLINDVIPPIPVNGGTYFRTRDVYAGSVTDIDQSWTGHHLINCDALSRLFCIQQ